MLTPGTIVQLNPQKYPAERHNYFMVSGQHLATLFIDQLGPAKPRMLTAHVDDVTRANIGWCGKHNTPMQFYTRDGHSWAAHRVSPGHWCSYSIRTIYEREIFTPYERAKMAREIETRTP